MTDHYPARLDNSEKTIQAANAVTLDRILQDFRIQWGIVDVVTSVEMRHLFSRHRYGQQDLDDTGRIREIIAAASTEELNYDECVRLAAKHAAQTENGVVVQDTAWEGYEEIPAWIMQGYGTMASEAAAQLKEAGCDRPTHIFIQAGVGSLAGAVQGYFANLFPGNCPTTVVVEASEAACLYKSAAEKDGVARFVDGDMQTIMAGLACGEPNTISWEILKNESSFFVSCPDWVSAKGMRMLAAPVQGDPQVISGESGAVSMGLLGVLKENPEYADLREAIGLDENSKVIMFSTEGDTDPENFKNVVWDGAYPSVMEK